MLRPTAFAPFALATLAWFALPAGAQCTYNPLTASTPVSSSAGSTLYTFTSPGTSWGAVGIRSAAGSEHGLGVFAQTAGSPTCVQNQVGSSALTGGVDLVIGDFHAGRTAPGPWYAQVTRSSGSGSVLTEWDPGAVELTVDDVPTVRNTDHVLNCYQVFLEAGITYIIAFAPSAGVDAKVLLFKNPGTGPYWAGRDSCVLQSTGQVSYQATKSDEYGIVVVNDDGGFSSYSLAVEQCQPPVTLASGSAVSTGPPLRYSIAQSAPYWSACGVRGSGADDWDILAYKTGHGRLEPECFQDTLVASQRRGGGVDLVTGDFNVNPTAPYFTRVIQVSGTQQGVVEWDDGPDEIPVGAAPLSRSVGPTSVIEIWDVNMTQGSAYSIYFQRAGAADTRFLVFENPGQLATTPYWAGRNNAVLTGTTSTDYAPSATGYHGIAVVNDNGGVGSYQLAVYGAATGVGGGPPGGGAIGIQDVRPNPVVGAARIAYRVGKPGRVAFDLLDVSGRRVERVAELDAATGPGTLAFDARAGGRRLPGGIYFARMSLDGASLSYRKFIVLP